MQETIRKEVIAYLSDKDSVLCKEVTMESVSKFSWPEANKQFQQKMPIFHDALKAAVTTPKLQFTAEWLV
jgi:hypothetical protein